MYRNLLLAGVLSVFLIGFLLIGCLNATTKAKDLTVEYRTDALGSFAPSLHNARNSAVTAYLVQASMRVGGRERHTAFGGDTLGFTNGQSAELPPNSNTTPGYALPRGAQPMGNYVAAVIWADGMTQGDDEIVSMLLSGRHRAWADLKAAIPLLENAADGRTPKEALIARFEQMRASDQSQGAQLDDMLEISSIRYEYFMSAVPAVGVALLQSGEPAALLARFREWQQQLSASKPDIR